MLITRTEIRDVTNAHSEALYGVHTLSPKVDHHLESLALYCGIVADDNEVHCGHPPCVLDGIDRDDVAHHRIPACFLGSASTLKWKLPGVAWWTPSPQTGQGFFKACSTLDAGTLAGAGTREGWATGQCWFESRAFVHLLQEGWLLIVCKILLAIGGRDAWDRWKNEREATSVSTNGTNVWRWVAGSRKMVTLRTRLGFWSCRNSYDGSWNPLFATVVCVLARILTLKSRSARDTSVR